MNRSNDVKKMRDFFLSIIHNDTEKFEEILSKTGGTYVNCITVDKDYFDYLNLSDELKKVKDPQGLPSSIYSPQINNDYSLPRINAFHLIVYVDTLLEEHKLRLLDLLVKYGRKVDYRSQINAQDMYGGYTPLHLAVKKGQSSVVEKLINYGADIEIQDNYGNTPYHLAAKTSQYKSLSIILGGLDRANINFNKANGEGDTLLKIAKNDSKLDNILKMHQTRSDIFKIVLPVVTITFLSSVSIYLVIMNKHSNNFQIGKGMVLAVALASAVVMVSLVLSLVVLTNKLSAVENTKLQDPIVVQEAENDLLEGNSAEDVSKSSLNKQSSLNDDISYDSVSNNSSKFKN